MRRNPSNASRILVLALAALSLIFAMTTFVYRNAASTSATSSGVTAQTSDDADSTNRSKNDQTLYDEQPP